MDEFLGVYMTDDGAIEIRRDMGEAQMWAVLKRVIDDYEATRSQIRRDMEEITRWSR